MNWRSPDLLLGAAVTHSNVEARGEGEGGNGLPMLLSLEDQLRHAEASRDQAVETAVAQARERAQASCAVAFRAEQHKWELVSTARGAAMEWRSVRRAAGNELDSIQADKQMLTVLLAGLDQSQKRIC